MTMPMVLTGSDCDDADEDDGDLAQEEAISA